MKRLLTLLTVMLMLVTVFALSVTANAANTYLSATTDKATYTVGDTAYVEIKTTYAEGIGSLSIDYSAFDTTVLTFNEGKSSWGDNGVLASFRDPFGKNVSAWAVMGLVDFSAKDYVVTYAFDITALPSGGSTEITFDFDAYGSNNKQAVFSEVVKVTLTVECTNHNYISEVDAQYLVSEANCQSPAIYKKSCEHCGAASATETFENGTKLDHTYTNGWVTDGDDTHTRKCDNFAVCGYSETVGHNWDAGSVVSEPSCYKLGVKKYTCTDNCGATKEENYGELKDHTYGDWTPNNDGTHSRTCQVAECGHVDGPHNCSYNGIVQIVGDKEHHKEICTVCEYDHLLDHNWGTGVETKAPSCAEGELTYTCECGEQKTEAIPATGEHDYTGVTWASAGDYKHIMKCNNCDEHKEEAHTLTNPVDNGDDHVGTCSVCGETDAHEAHKWDNGKVTKEPSCFEKGTMTYTCTDNCGATKEEDIDPTNAHVWGAWTNNEAEGNHVHTCTTPGCGKTEPAAHNWDNGKVTKEPSCFENGTMTYTCTDGCGATKEEDIDPTNAHVWGAWADNGDNHVRYCTTVGCGEPNYADHDWSHNCDTLCDTCGHTRTVVHIYGHVATADEHWNACGICGDIEPGSRAPHNVVNGECADCGYKASRPMSGFFYVNDDYHMMVLTDGVITGHHILDVNGDCTICGAHISDVVEDEIVIEAPVESDTEETETEPVVNPTTGLAFALITVAAAAAVAVASKKH